MNFFYAIIMIYLREIFDLEHKKNLKFIFSYIQNTYTLIL